jgi:hypothetical protein
VEKGKITERNNNDANNGFEHVKKMGVAGATCHFGFVWKLAAGAKQN